MIGGGKNRPELRSANHDFSCEIQGGIKVLTISATALHDIQHRVHALTQGDLNLEGPASPPKIPTFLDRCLGPNEILRIALQ
jgi:hypothetical protein